MSIKEILYKLFNSQKYKELKYLKKDKEKLSIFKNNYEKEIILIRKKIENQKSLNFLHSGHAADIINVLPVLKKLSQDHQKLTNAIYTLILTNLLNSISGIQQANII